MVLTKARLLKYDFPVHVFPSLFLRFFVFCRFFVFLRLCQFLSLVPL